MQWLTLFINLLPTVIKTIQTVVGDKASGATKKQMALDAWTSASGVVNGVLDPGVAKIASTLIDTTVADSKATGAYAQWTAAATELHKDPQVLAAVTSLASTAGGGVAKPKVAEFQEPQEQPVEQEHVSEPGVINHN